MQARAIGRASATSQARLQLLLILLAAWDALAFVLELTSARFLDIGSIDGLLGARAVGGSTLVLAIAYLYAARNPVRYRFIIWLASLEQVVAIFSIGFHWARGDVGAGESVVPMVIAAGFLALLAVNLPRQTDTI
jgi:hypothetical protein